MKPSPAHNLDFLAALLHGRRSRLAEGSFLDALSRLKLPSELFQVRYPTTPPLAVKPFQRRLTEDLINELAGVLQHLDGPAHDLMAWMLVRFQFENIKVLARGLANRIPLEEVLPSLVPVPGQLARDLERLRRAESFEVLLAHLPCQPTRQWLRAGARFYRAPPQPFFLEAWLDHCYFLELLCRAERLSGEGKDLVKPLVLQEIDIFHLGLALRGKFHYGLSSVELMALHIPGTEIPARRFARLLCAPDARTAAADLRGRVLDQLPSAKQKTGTADAGQIAELEALAWNRFLRLANCSFRRSQMGLGVVFGYVGTRRIEVANLIRLSEATRFSLGAQATRAQLFPHQEMEAGRV